MSAIELWIAIVALAGVTLVTRASMLFLPARIQLPPRLQRALRYAGPCVLAAIVMPDLLRRNGAIDIGLDNIRLVAALVGVVVFLMTRNAVMTIVAGLVALTVLRLLG
jgi:branched-subunit amino acid transport protein